MVVCWWHRAGDNILSIQVFQNAELFKEVEFHSKDGLEMALLYMEDGHEVVIHQLHLGRDCIVILEVSQDAAL